MHLIVTGPWYIQSHEVSAVNVYLFTSLFERVQYSYQKLVHPLTFVRLWYVSDFSKILAMYIHEFTKTGGWKEINKF